MNLPNSITIARVLFIPVFLFFLFAPFTWGDVSFSSYTIAVTQLIAAVIFALLSFTDWVDGYVARKFHLVSTLGKFLDPLADKLLMTAGFVSLVELSLIPAWAVIVILSREFAVTGLRVLAASEGIVIAADKWGKWKTTFQIISVLLLLFNVSGFVSLFFLIGAVSLTIYSGFNYFSLNRAVFSAR